MVAGVKFGPYAGGMLRIADDGVEIYHRIEVPFGTNPLIDFLTDFFASLGRGADAFFRHDRGADDLDAMLVASVDELPVAPDQLVAGKRFGPVGAAADIDVVDAFEQDHPFGAGMSENVAVETRQSAQTGAIAQYLIARYALVHDPDVLRCLVGIQPLGQQSGPPWLASRVVWNPSVIESPNATTVYASAAAATTSTLESHT